MSLSTSAPPDSPSTPPSPSDLYWLRTSPHPSTPTKTKFSNLRIRFHGSGIPAVVLTPEPPKFLRFHLSSTGQQVATSWRPEHAGRYWGFVLGNEKGKKMGGWAPVEMYEGKGDGDFGFGEGQSEGEGLVWKGEVSEDNEEGGEGEKRSKWTGWVACEWAHGHPQLFWVTDELKGELPEFCERVVLVREPVVGQGPQT